MSQFTQTLRNAGLFLFGMVMLVTGYKINDAHAQEKAQAAKTAKEAAKALDIQATDVKASVTEAVKEKATTATPEVPASVAPADVKAPTAEAIKEKAAETLKEKAPIVDTADVKAPAAAVETKAPEVPQAPTAEVKKQVTSEVKTQKSAVKQKVKAVKKTSLEKATREKAHASK